MIDNELAETETELEAETEQEEAEEVIVSIGDAPSPEDAEEPAPGWVRELRKQNREKDKRIRELEAMTQKAENKPALGEKPTRESCDWDDELYDTRLAEWYAAKADHDKAQMEAEARKKAEEEAWNAKLEAYQTGKKRLRVPDYEDAEAVVLEQFSVTQQGIVIQGSDDPALLAYAIGKNPEKAKELASITDPVKFAFAVAKIETQVKTMPRNSKPAPEKVVSTSGPLGGSTDKTLDKLREAAARDPSKMNELIAYKRKLRQT